MPLITDELDAVQEYFSMLWGEFPRVFKQNSNVNRNQDKSSEQKWNWEGMSALGVELLG